MELFAVAYFAFDFDCQIDIGGTLCAAHVTSVQDHSRDAIKKAIILVHDADPVHESLNGIIGVLAMHRLGSGGAAKILAPFRQLVPSLAFLLGLLLFGV